MKGNFKESVRFVVRMYLGPHRDQRTCRSVWTLSLLVLVLFKLLNKCGTSDVGLGTVFWDFKLLVQAANLSMATSNWWKWAKTCYNFNLAIIRTAFLEPQYQKYTDVPFALEVDIVQTSL